jgi:hypothetical protein
MKRFQKKNKSVIFELHLQHFMEEYKKIQNYN